MRWSVSLVCRATVCLAIGLLAIAASAQTHAPEGGNLAPAGRHETPTHESPSQVHTPSSAGSIVNPASGPASSTTPARTPAPAGQGYGLASHPRDSSPDVGNGVTIAIPVLGPSLEVDPPIVDMSSDPNSALSQERLSPRRWMTRSPNRQFKGAGYKSFVGSPYKGCEQLCLREAGCIAIEFRHSDNRCQLFDRREDSAAAPQSDIGFVRQQASR